MKTRAAAYDFLVGLVAVAEKRAARGDEAKAAAVRALLVMIAAGLAGSSQHMMAASLSALSRLMFEFKSRPALVRTCVQLFETVMMLLKHRAQVKRRAQNCRTRSRIGRAPNHPCALNWLRRSSRPPSPSARSGSLRCPPTPSRRCSRASCPRCSSGAPTSTRTSRRRCATRWSASAHLLAYLPYTGTC